MRRTAIVLTAGLALAGCGGSAGSPEEEVKDVYVDFVEALIDEETGEACAMTNDVESCLEAMAQAESFLGKSSYEDILPNDWRDLIEDAEVTFSDDDHATIPPISEVDDPTDFVREDGGWRLVMEDLLGNER